MSPEGEPDFLVVFKSQGVREVRVPFSVPCGAPYSSLLVSCRLCSGITKIEDMLGNAKVALTRQFGNETCVLVLHLRHANSRGVWCSIRLMFSIADLQGYQGEDGMDGEVAHRRYPSVAPSPSRCVSCVLHPLPMIAR